MRLARLLLVLVALAPSAAEAQGVIYKPGVHAGPQMLPASLRASSVVGVVDFDRFGRADWGPGIPTPTLECVADASGGGMTCTGSATASKQGSPTTVGSPWYPSGFSGPQQMAVSLNGSTDYFTLGNAAGQHTGHFTKCVIFSENAGQDGYLFSREDPGAGKSVFDVSTYLTNFYFNVFKASGTGSTIYATGIVHGPWNVACGAYQYVADGTSRLRLNVNGTAVTEVTNAVGPPSAFTDIPLLIGARQNNGTKIDYFPGRISKIADFDGWAASNAELATMTKAQRGLIAKKPATAELTFARSDATLCCPVSDAECFWLAPNVPCIQSATATGGAGVRVDGVGSNLLANTSLDTWTPVSAAPHTIAAQMNVTGPDGVANSAATVTFAGGALSADDYNLARSTPVLTDSTVHTYSVWVKRGTYDQGTIALDAAPAGAYTATVCAISTAAWTRCSITFTSAVAGQSDLIDFGGLGSTYIPSPAVTQGTGTLLVYCPQVDVGPTPRPCRLTSGTAYSGSAGTATSLSIPVSLTNPAQWAVVTKGQAPWSASPSFAVLGTGGAGNSAQMYAVGPYAYVMITNASAQFSYVRSAAGGYNNLSDWTQHTLMGWFDGVQTHFTLDTVGNDGTWNPTGTPGWGAVPSVLTLGATGVYSRVLQCKKAGGCK